MANSSITGNVLGPASSSSAGLVTTAAQTFAGAKTFNSGVVFTGGGTQTNLNWYEEGNWTPTIGGSSADFTTVTYSKQVGIFTRIGRMIHIQGYIGWTNTTGSPVGTLIIRGLPYTSKNQTDLYSVSACGEFSNIDIAGTATNPVLGLELGPNDNKLVCIGSGDNVSTVPVSAASNGGAVARQMLFFICYVV